MGIHVFPVLELGTCEPFINPPSILKSDSSSDIRRIIKGRPSGSILLLTQTTTKPEENPYEHY
jgi:hypothetical protein